MVMQSLASQSIVSIPFESGHSFQHATHNPRHFPSGSVSIPFESGHSFQRRQDSCTKDHLCRVSIPFESGHSFQPRPQRLCSMHWLYTSQSPSNRGTLSNEVNTLQPREAVQSQSPSNRGTLSNPTIGPGFTVGSPSLNPLRIGALFPTYGRMSQNRGSKRVSIPFESGHSFQHNELDSGHGHRSRVSIPFESGHSFQLFH